MRDTQKVCYYKQIVIQNSCIDTEKICLAVWQWHCIEMTPLSTVHLKMYCASVRTQH